MDFIADLHIHSPFSRATSKQMTLPALHDWAQLKGITVLGSGDFTHPRWFAVLEEKLEPAEPGLFRLKKKFREESGLSVPDSCSSPVRFILSVEISTIYKKADRTRKVHSLILCPDFAAAGRLSAALQQIGNISSDGRPILGLDCKRLLEMALEASPENVFIPAHIWTPHFSVLGAASGFDSIQECFEDMTPHIFALETGLSSDPPMNWMLSGLDDFVLVSNSDAHSPRKLAREANIFSCELSYHEMMRVLREKDRSGFKGTLEFFPEEGKYHYDGHRPCSQCFTPEQTAAHEGRCPVCGRKITVGVLNRVLALADRDHGFRPPQAFDFESLIPLEEVIAEVIGVGPASKRVANTCYRLLEHFGSELFILRHCPLADLRAAGHDLLAEALGKIRAGNITMQPGYDGVYGSVRIFNPGERPTKQLSLFKACS